MAVDVRAVLDIANATDAYLKLDDKEMRYVGRTYLGLGGGKQMVVISESGLYKLIMRSNKPQAKPFQPDNLTSAHSK